MSSESRQTVNDILKASFNLIFVILIKRADNIARMGACRILVGKPKGKGPLGRPRHVGEQF
jgi:hypothetical protein